MGAARVPFLRLLTASCGLAWSLLAAPAGAVSVPDFQSAELRVLKLRHHETGHPHRNAAGEYRLLSAFAAREGLNLRWIDAVRPAELSAMLARGEGDVVIADLAGEDIEREQFDAGLPVGRFTYQVMGRRELDVSDPLDLSGLRVAVSIASPLWPYMTRLEETIPALTVVTLPDSKSREAALTGITDGRYDAAVVSVRQGESPAAAMPRVRRLFTLEATRASRWYYATDQAALRERIDAYLMQTHTLVRARHQAMGDLDAIRARHVLRVITRVDPRNFYVDGGNHAGFEYELVRTFAEDLGLGLEFLVAESDQQALDWLTQGHGDIVTTRVDAERVTSDPALIRSVPYYHAASVFIHRTGSRHGTGDGSNGQKVGALAGSVQHRALAKRLAHGLVGAVQVFAADTPLEALAAALSAGEIDALLIDAHNVEHVVAAGSGLVAGASLDTAFDYAWTLRTVDGRLSEAVDTFIREQFRQATYNVLTRRYFGPRHDSGLDRPRHLSPFDALVQKHALAHDFDWRLIVAQMYQESRFDPLALSSTGARGLMQLQPATARDLGVIDAHEPEAAIGAGVAYLASLRGRFEEHIGPRDRTWFALAAYNIGYGAVERARRHAVAEGLNPDRWFGHVEQAMRSLSGGQSRYRWGQTVAYLRAIRSLYNTYYRLHETLTAGVEPRSRAPAS